MSIPGHKQLSVAWELTNTPIISSLAICKDSTIDAIQFSTEHGALCPVNWKPELAGLKDTLA